MSTAFDSDVYARRNHTPWSTMSLTAFMRDMAVSTVDFADLYNKLAAIFPKAREYA